MYISLQCFDAVGWAAGTAPDLLKTEWWSTGVVICLGRGADLHRGVARSNKVGWTVWVRFGEGYVMDTYHRVCQLTPPICSVERY